MSAPVPEPTDTYTERGPSPAILFFGAAVLASAFVLALFLSELTFWRDEWAFLLHRGGFGVDVFFDPHNEHIAIIPVAIYKSLLSVFGMTSPAPFQVVAVALFLVSVVVLFMYLRVRIGEWLALAGCLPILFFGSSWDDLLWPFQMGYFGSMSCGIGALLALDRNTPRADTVACVLLVASLGFSSVGLPFCAGVAILIAATNARRRAYVVIVPVLFYGLWWLGWGREAENVISVANFASSPGYVVDGFASSLSSLLGLGTPRDETAITALDWGRPLLAGVLVLAGVLLFRARRIAIGVWVVVAIAIAFWFLAALNSSVVRLPESGRYQYVGAIFILLIAAELLRGVRLPKGAVLAVIVIAVLSAVSNFNYLQQYWNAIKPTGEQQPGGLAALEIVRDDVDPAFLLTQRNSDVDYLGELDAGSYLAAVDAFGSPAYTPQELANASEQAKVAADKVFASALRLGLVPVVGESSGRSCAGTPVEPGAPVELPEGGVVVRAPPGTAPEVRLTRYAESSTIIVGTLASGDSAALQIPPDRSSQPWQLQVSESAEICR